MIKKFISVLSVVFVLLVLTGCIRQQTKDPIIITDKDDTAQIQTEASKESNDVIESTDEVQMDQSEQSEEMDQTEETEQSEASEDKDFIYENPGFELEDKDSSDTGNENINEPGGNVSDEKNEDIDTSDGDLLEPPAGYSGGVL